MFRTPFGYAANFLDDFKQPSSRGCRVAPTELHRPHPGQAEAWPAIQAGRNVLIAAPASSGKTLAAFLRAIETLVRKGMQDGLKDETVSPFKACPMTSIAT